MIINSAASGINAAFEGIRTVSNNTANINTDGYKAKQAKFREDKEGGVIADQETINTAGAQYIDQEGNTHEMSNVKFEKEATNMMQYQAMSKLNIATLKTQDEMLGTLLDTFA